MPAPGAFDLQVYEDTDNTADLVTSLDTNMALMRERRDENPCHSLCSSCTRVVFSGTNKDVCSGCPRDIKGQAAKEWTICFIA